MLHRQRPTHSDRPATSVAHLPAFRLDAHPARLGPALPADATAASSRGDSVWRTTLTQRNALCRAAATASSLPSFTGTRSHGASGTKQAELTAADAVAYDTFCSSVALSGDTGLVGASNKTVSEAERRRRRLRLHRSGASWSQQAELSDPDLDG